MFVEIAVVTPPAQLPVDISELKAQARLTDPTDANELAALNELLTRVIGAAVERCEGFTRRSLITQTIDVWYDEMDGVGVIEHLPRSPIQEVVGVFAYDDSGVELTQSTEIYSLAGTTLVFNTWPDYFRKRRGIKIRLKNGFGDDPEDVPPLIRQGILEYAAFLYEHREGEASDSAFASQIQRTGGLPQGVYEKWQRWQERYV